MDQLKKGVTLKKTAAVEKPPTSSSSSSSSGGGGGGGEGGISELMRGIQLGTSRLKKVETAKKTTPEKGKGLFKDAAVRTILARRAAIDVGDDSDENEDEWD